VQSAAETVRYPVAVSHGRFLSLAVGQTVEWLPSHSGAELVCLHPHR
jgi:hypothetical protein